MRSSQVDRFLVYIVSKSYIKNFFSLDGQIFLPVGFYFKPGTTHSRKMFLSLTLPFLLCFLAATCDAGGNVLHWHEMVAKTPAKKIHEVIFVVKMRNLDKLDDKVREVSDPTSDKYLQHWSKKEVDDFVRNPESSQKVKEFILANGLTYQEDKTDGAEIYLHAQGTIDTLETLFEAKFHDYRHEYEKNVYSRSLDMTMHSSLKDHVTCIMNMVDFNPGEFNLFKCNESLLHP